MQLRKFLSTMAKPEHESCLIKMYREWIDLAEKSEVKNGSFSERTNLKEIEMLKYIRDLEEKIRNLIDTLDEFNEENKSLKRQVSSLRESQSADYRVDVQHKWATFSKEILKLAKKIFNEHSHISGDQEKRTEYLQILNQFEEFLSLNMNDLMMERLQTPLERKPASWPDDFHAQSIAALDYGKVKGFLMTSAEDMHEIIYTIVKSLKAKIMRTGFVTRSHLVRLYIHVDLLDAAAQKPAADCIFHKLVTHSYSPIREESFKLLHLFCLFRVGRDYLAQNKHILQTVVDSLRAEKSESSIRRRSISILQKLSLIKDMHGMLIDENMVEYCLEVLAAEQDTLSSYSLDYFAWLLMNLCYRKSGRERMVRTTVDIFELFENLLHFEGSKIRTPINSILFSIMSMPELKRKAKESGFLDRLRSLKARLSDRYQHQIDFIVQIAEQPAGSESPDHDQEDKNNELDEQAIEEDISDGRLLSADGDELCEKFLAETFPPTREQQDEQDEAVRNVRLSQSALNAQFIEEQDRPLNRLGTPSMMARKLHRGAPGSPESEARGAPEDPARGLPGPENGELHKQATLSFNNYEGPVRVSGKEMSFAPSITMATNRPANSTNYTS